MSDNPRVPEPQFIFHHFDTSPFSEKVRLVFGFKQLRWRSVKVPVMLPKPDVVALTGGYRRTPVLQVGADVYCDTALICRAIEQLAPQPTLFPPAASALQQIVAQWADSALFWSAIPYTTQPAGMAHLFGDSSLDYLKALAADRAAMTAGMKRSTAVDATAQLRSYLSWLASLFADGRPFVLGAEPCIADFSAVHPLWFIRLAPALAGILEPYGALLAWYDRVSGFGHGQPEPLEPSDAIAIAATAGGHAPADVAPGLGFERGAQVTVCATDYASDLVPGTLVGLSTGEVVLERRDDRAGTVHVHFPRIGYQIKKAS
jgi:glutathione S-transferase